MNGQKISTFLRKTGVVASLLAASAAVTGSLAPSASAFVLVPDGLPEGEVNVGLGCLEGPCYEPSDISLIANIESLVDATTGTMSRLFLDDLTTANTYNGGALGTAIFLAGDEGTVPTGLFFRPSETRANGAVGEESGRLEVGTYRFTFKNPLAQLRIRYFDTESANSTGIPNFGGILETDGTLVAPEDVNPIPAGPDGNIQYQTLENVSFITLKLGQDVPNGTGDGVDFQFEATETVPEPATLAGLGLVAGAMAVSRRRKASKAS